MQKYHNGVAVPGDGYWDNEPIYAPKTERCTIGAFAPAPAPPPDKNPLTRGLTSAMNTMMPEGPTGLRMAGHYAGQGGLALEFAVDAVTLDCGAAHVKGLTQWRNGSNQIQIIVKNGASPFTLALQPNGAPGGLREHRRGGPSGNWIGCEWWDSFCSAAMHAVAWERLAAEVKRSGSQCQKKRDGLRRPFILSRVKLRAS